MSFDANKLLPSCAEIVRTDTAFYTILLTNDEVLLIDSAIGSAAIEALKAGNVEKGRILRNLADDIMIQTLSRLNARAGGGP